MEEAAEELRKINEKVDLIQTENKFIAKRLAKDLDQRERSANGAHRIGSLLDQVLELSEADKRQNDEVSEMIFAILETNKKISELNRIITELHKSGGNLFVLVEDVDQEVNEVNSLLTSGSNSCLPGNSVADDVVEELSISENRELTKTESNQLEENIEDINTCGSESVSLTVDGNTEVDLHLHHIETDVKESASLDDQYVLDQKGDDKVVKTSALTEDAGNKTSSGTDGGFSEMMSAANGEIETSTEKKESSDSSKELPESAKEWKDKLSQAEEDSLKKLRKRKTPIDVDNRCSVMIEEKSQRKTEREEKETIGDIPASALSEELDTPISQFDPKNMLEKAAAAAAAQINTLLKQSDPDALEKAATAAVTQMDTLFGDSKRVGNDFWLEKAAEGAAEHKRLEHQQGGGLDIIFVLDTSSSMEGEGLRQMKGVVTDILNECERMSKLNTNVGIVTFGHENKFLRLCCNRYYSLKESLLEIRCGGPSPLAGGLLLTEGASGAVGISRIRNWHVRPVVVLISDGIITDHHYPEGPEDMEPGGSKHFIMEELLNIVQNVGNSKSIWCVPVGDPDMSILEAISGLSSGGKIIHLHEAKKIGRFPKNVRISAQLCEIMQTCDKLDRHNFQALMSSIVSGSDLTDSDWDDIYEMVTTSRKEFKSPEELIEEVDDMQCQERYSYMPPIGTRVKRGSEWHWGDQDKHGPGTVIGHSTDPGWIIVNWDAGDKYSYPYGANGDFSIVVCDSPRVLDDQIIAVGCLVTRGPDWEWGDQDGGEGSIGVVYRVNDVAIIHVRWPNGAKSNYRFGFDGKFDVKICDPFSTEVQRVLQHQATTASASNLTLESASNSSKNIEKKTDRKDSLSEQEPQMSFEEIRRTGNSLNIMDMAPPVKYTVWSDIPISTPTTNRSRSLRVNQNLESGQRNTVASHVENTTQDGHSIPNTQTSQNPPMKDFVSTEIPQTAFSKSKECIIGSPKESVEQVVDIEDLKPVQSNGQLDAHGQHSGNRFLSTTDSFTQNETSDKQQEPSIETSSDNKSCDQVPRWQWKHPNGQWTSYPEDIQEKLKKNFLKNPKSTVLISMSESHFRVVFSKNKHINTETKESAEIRRIYE